MSKIKDGGPAFPRDHAHEGHNGMTLRDYFAGKAPAYHADWLREHCRITGYRGKADAQARWAYEYADAMLAAREQQP